MASPSSFSYSFHNLSDAVSAARSCAANWSIVPLVGVVEGEMPSLSHADAVSAARSCADTWSIVSLVGVLEGEVACLCVGGGGGCVCCGGESGSGWCGGVDVGGGGGGGVGVGGLVLDVACVWGAVVGGVFALVGAVCGVVLCCVLDFLLSGVWLLWSFLFCRWCVGFLGCFGDLFLVVFP